MLTASMLVAVLARPAASDDCREEDLDAQGRCPGPKPQPPKPQPPRPTPEKPAQLDIRGPDITGVAVSLDGQPAGRAPLVVPATPGRHLVEVKRDGYAPYAEWVELKKGEQKVVQVKLQPAPTAPAPPPAAQPTARPAAPKPASCPAGMVRVPAGTFQMGNPEGVGLVDGYPQHAVTLSGYCIDKTEVTVKAYRACVAAKGCSATDLKVDLHCNREDRPDHPINCVDWNQATAYCKWADKRLPTEAEWEYAARGADGRAYPWGNEAPSAKRLNACGSECAALRKREQRRWSAMYEAGDGWETTAPVSSFPDGKSPFGALDMAGNVWEWTGDWIDHYPAEAVTDPQGAKTGTQRVFRGGSWGNNRARDVRAVERAWDAPANAGDGIGFRCARGD